MGSEWTNIGDIAQVFDGPHATPKKITEGPYFLSISSLHQGQLDLSKSARISEEQFKKWTRRVTPQEGDVLFSYETRLGEAALMPSDIRACLGRRMGLLRPDRNKVDPSFLLFAYLGPEFQQEIKTRTISGATVDRIALKELPSFPIRIPPIEEQKAIAGILKAIDDKITLNRQINTTLESMAQALFKSWFVDFDPVIDNALAADNPIPEPLQARAQARAALGDQRKPLPESTRHQFPDRFVFTEALGWVPEGWALVMLKDLTKKIGSGATPRGGKHAYVDAGTALIRSQNVYDTGFTWKGLAFITPNAADQLRNVVVEPDDVLLNITGASILRTCVVSPEVLPARVNQHVAIVRANDGVPARFLHLHLSQRRTKDYLMGLNAGASREAVTKAHIESVPVLKPGKSLLTEFNSLTLPMFNRVHEHSAANRSLSSLRDTLLPKLLSGELRVPEAERQVAEVI